MEAKMVEMVAKSMSLLFPKPKEQSGKQMLLLVMVVGLWQTRSLSICLVAFLSFSLSLYSFLPSFLPSFFLFLFLPFFIY